MQTFLQTGNILWCPIETMCASSDGTEPCIAESALGSMLPERISAEATGLSSIKSGEEEESSIMMVVCIQVSKKSSYEGRHNKPI